MEQIIISQNNNQEINILSNEPQFITLTNSYPQDINIKSTDIQELSLKEKENQILYINEQGSVIGITDVLVNGISVVSNNIAYVIVPTKVSQLQNDSGYITNEIDPTVPYYIKEISISDINSWNNKQNLLISGSNIKTINNNSLLGSGNLNVGGADYTAGTGISIDSENVINNTITSYNDLTDLPTIPSTTSDLTNDSGFVSSNDLATVAFTGSYDDLIDEPTVPTNTSELVNDSGYIDKNVNDLTYYTLSSNLSAVATSGNYSDLSGTPTIPTNTSDLVNDSGYIDKNVNDLTYYTLSSNLSTVATSGNYEDLSNIPQDSGWQSPTLTANFKDYNNNTSNHPKYRKIGKIVTIQGIVTPTTTLASTSDQVIFTLPSGYTPSMEIRTICQGSGMNRWMLSVFSGGNVCISRYGISSQDNISSGNWLPFYVTYFVD